ncbi:ice-binding family protein [Cryobacterium tepidiphilum]|uniref:DUF3494 domain-containing protein n=1 Tax=Cryobacterium tepidiphilum TaxID=2486026 RepID=A0A3M8KZ50_9MICO|nr:ice-binding family protein [Cryobacterium tepidiphilum]RNE58557.1 DUF3494 domain-containing protein [Cryobacterium tepidiphilum]
MTRPSFRVQRVGWAASGILLAAVASFLSAGSAQGATASAGPIDLGAAGSFGVLAGSAVTNTGPTRVIGDVGVSAGTSITGFTGAPNGAYTGTLHQTDTVAGRGQNDLTTAYNSAAGLTPTTSGLSELDGLSLTPGVYSGGALSLADNGTLTLAGSASSVWVFQAASTLTIGSGTDVILTGGASACNVFWQVGSSATLGTTAHFEGTVLADQSISATTGATIAGRLLARTAAVTLDTNTITVPSGCGAPAGPTTSSPLITSAAPPAATVGTAYAFTVTATGTPAPVFAVTAGRLPAGLSLDAATGAITGTPTAAGTATLTITAGNGVTPDATATYTIATGAAARPTPTPTPTPTSSVTLPSTAQPETAAPIAPVSTTTADATQEDSSGASELAATGSNSAVPGLAGMGLFCAGIILVMVRRRSRGQTAD